MPLNWNRKKPEINHIYLAQAIAAKVGKGGYASFDFDLTLTGTHSWNNYYSVTINNQYYYILDVKKNQTVNKDHPIQFNSINSILKDKEFLKNLFQELNKKEINIIINSFQTTPVLKAVMEKADLKDYICGYIGSDTFNTFDDKNLFQQDGNYKLKKLYIGSKTNNYNKHQKLINILGQKARVIHFDDSPINGSDLKFNNSPDDTIKAIQLVREEEFIDANSAQKLTEKVNALSFPSLEKVEEKKQVKSDEEAAKIFKNLNFTFEPLKKTGEFVKKYKGEAFSITIGASVAGLGIASSYVIYNHTNFQQSNLYKSLEKIVGDKIAPITYGVGAAVLSALAGLIIGSLIEAGAKFGPKLINNKSEIKI